MANTKVNFTKAALTNLPPPTDNNKRIYYYDSKTRGLGICVSASGTRTFILYRKINGRPERITLGRFPDLTVEQARGKASEMNSIIAKGENPAQHYRLVKTELTLAEAFREYSKKYAKVHKETWQEDENQYNRYLSNWKNRKLSAIAKTDIQKLHHETGEQNGHYAANRLLALLHGLFNRMQEFGYWNKPNPVQGIKKFKEQSRSRFLQADELPRSFKALGEDSNENARDYILLSLLTGARRGNVLAMRWEELHLTTGLWHIPKTKNGEAHTVPLVPQALEILKNRHAKKETEWVFPSTGKSGHLADPKKAWKRILTNANIKNLRLHDLRRSLGSWQAATGASLSIIGKTLAHKNVNTTAIYARLNIDPVRDAMNKATQAIWEAANVVIDNETAINADENIEILP